MFAGIFLIVIYCWLIVVIAIKNDSNIQMRKPSTVSSIMKNTKIPKKIPLSIIMELNQVTDISELFNKFLPNVNVSRTLVASSGFQSRSGLSNQRRSDILTKSTGCSVENKTISLKDSDDPSLYYYPACTRVNRCGGCCSHELLSCQPNITETINVNVKIIQFVGAREFKPFGTKSLFIEQHLKCMCQCIIKKEDCNKFQSYDHNECRCMCNNEEDHEKCNEEYNLKIWNPGTCACECRDTKECTEGFRFDYNTCRCEASSTIQRNTSNVFNRNSYPQILIQRQPYTAV